MILTLHLFNSFWLQVKRLDKVIPVASNIIILLNLQVEQHQQKLIDAEKQKNSAQPSGTLYY